MIDTNNVLPATKVTVTNAELMPALKNLLNGEYANAASPEEQFSRGTDDSLLRGWLRQINPSKPLSNDFLGRTHTQQPQKAANCGTENIFGFMATTLPPEDYKLAKATCLNATIKLGDAIIEQDAANLRMDMQRTGGDPRNIRESIVKNMAAVERIRERENTAIDGRRRILDEQK